MMISYAHKDEKLRQAFDEHLALLKKRRLIDVWQDRLIRPGGNWAADIDDGMRAAQIILMLVSPAFFASGYITGVELTLALKRQERGETALIPVILREGDYTGAPFSHLKELPIDGLAEGRSVTGRRWRNRDEAFRNVTEGIRREAETLRGRRLEDRTVNIYVAREKRKPSAAVRAEVRGIGETFGGVVADRRVLWVDDYPENNLIERAALTDLGVQIDTALSTHEGMTALRKRSYDLVISDWTRGRLQAREELSEGMRLLRQMRSSRIFTPLIFYSGQLPQRVFAKRRALAAAGGASGITADPKELFRWTIGELVRCSAFDANADFVETPLYDNDVEPTSPRSTRGKRSRKPRAESRP
jgi:CheY-like chemotaxis protein